MEPRLVRNEEGRIAPTPTGCVGVCVCVGGCEYVCVCEELKEPLLNSIKTTCS